METCDNHVISVFSTRIPRPFRIACLLLVLALSAAGMAQERAELPATRTLAVESYGLDEGLAQSSVISMAEDGRGFLWFGTQEGLHRFDGHRFSVLRHEPGQADSLVSSTMDVLQVDSQERLWMGSNDAGLEVIDLASLERWRFATEAGLSHLRVIDISVAPSGSSALVATAGGVDRVGLPQADVTNLITRDGLIGLVRLPEDGWLAADRDCEVVYSDGRTRRPGVSPSAICVALAQTPDGTAWLATERGELVRVGPEDVSLAAPPIPFARPQARVSSLFADDNGRLLIGDSKGGVVEWDPSRPGQRSRWQLGIGQSEVESFFRDRSGVLWIGTFAGGLHRVLPLSETVLSSRAPDRSRPINWPDGIVWAIRRDERFSLLGTENGLFVQPEGSEGWTRQPDLAGLPIIAIAADHTAGGYWIGTYQGLWRWNPPETPYPVVPGGLPDERITDLLEHEGRLYVTTQSGLAVLVDERLRPDAVPEELRPLFLTTLALDRDGSIWVGSNENGAYRFRPGAPSEHFFTGSREQSSRSIWDIHFQDDRVWLGSFGGGLLELDRQGNVQRRITESDGLPNNVVYRILRDGENRLWLSTNQGLGIVDPNGGQVQQLGRRDGLRNQEFNAWAAWQDGDGMLHFGGVDGVDSVDSAAFSLESTSAQPVVAGLTIAHEALGILDAFPGLNASLPYADELRLDPRNQVFSLRLVALDFNAPSAARLRYRVDGLHEDWLSVNGPEAEFAVNYLSPGRYRLHIEAAGRDGRFSNRHELDIVLTPPAWRHPTAYVLYAVLLVLLLALIAWRVHRNIHYERRQVETLHRQVAERTAELRQLNERLHRSNEELDRATRRDPLTGLSNRRDFLDWIERTQPGGDRRLLFLMIDIDDFKQINDTRGHAVGDQVLVNFGQRLGHFCRADDILVRWGGEEFLLVVDDIDPDRGADLARRICKAVAEEPLHTAEGEAMAVTCSVGYAPWPILRSVEAPNSWELSADLADRALYAAKAAGKNGWRGLVAGPEARPDSFAPPASGLQVTDMIEGGVLEMVSSTAQR
jgi:diguanylate cyclase (GGDEF)-like protein